MHRSYNNNSCEPSELFDSLHLAVQLKKHIYSIFPNALSTIIIRAMPPRVSKTVNSDEQWETANVNPFDSIRGCWQCVSLNRMALGGNLFTGVTDICQRLWMYMKEREFDSADISLNHTQGCATLLSREANKKVSFLLHPPCN